MFLSSHDARRATTLLAGFALSLCIACGGSSGTTSSGTTSSGTGGGTFPAGTQTMALTLPPLPVPKGEQKVYCTNMHLTNTEAIEVIGFQSQQSEGGHHLLLFANKTDLADAAPVECTQNLDPTQWSLLYASQIPMDTQIFPNQTGITIAPHQSVMLQTHYINATSSDLNVTSEVDLKIGPAGSVTTPLAPLLFYNLGLSVPVGLSTAASTCTMTDDLNVIMLAGHMHKNGTDFKLDLKPAGGQSQQVYETLTWDSPQEKLFQTPLAVAKGSDLTWTCNYNNQTSATINQPDEMCATLGNFYPATRGALLCFGFGPTCTCVYDH